MGDCLLQFWIAVLAAWTLVGRPGDVMLLKFEIPVLVEVEGRQKKRCAFNSQADRKG